MLQAQLLIRFLIPTVIAAYPMCHQHLQRKMEIFPRFFHCLHVQMFPPLIEKFWHRRLIQPNLTSLPSSIPPSLTPLTSVGLKYSSFTPQRFNSENTSMLDLLGNSSLDVDLDIEIISQDSQCSNCKIREVFVQPS